MRLLSHFSLPSQPLGYLLSSLWNVKCCVSNFFIFVVGPRMGCKLKRCEREDQAKNDDNNSTAGWKIDFDRDFCYVIPSKWQFSEAFKTCFNLLGSRDDMKLFGTRNFIPLRDCQVDWDWRFIFAAHFPRNIYIWFIENSWVFFVFRLIKPKIEWSRSVLQATPDGIHRKLLHQSEKKMRLTRRNSSFVNDCHED